MRPAASAAVGGLVDIVLLQQSTESAALLADQIRRLRHIAARREQNLRKVLPLELGDRLVLRALEIEADTICRALLLLPRITARTRRRDMNDFSVAEQIFAV